jgi:Na+/proline symporter
MPQWLTIVATGAVVLIMSLLGGSWTSTASDFVQMLLLMPITVVAAVLALMKIGGVGNFFARTPSHFWRWNEAAHSNVIGLWIVAMLCQKWVALNNMTDASRYLSVKDTKHARKAALLATILFVIGPGVWFIPPMVARIVYPDLRAVFPDQKNLPNVQDASYFAIGLATMPVGMIGLLISGIFASTMGQMDSGLNRNAGFFVKNFYQVKLRPHANERELLLTSRIATVVFGALIVLATLWFASLEDMPIFKLMVNFGGWVALPVSIPLIWGMFIRRAPQWAGWSTVLVGLVTSYLTYKYLGPAWLSSTFDMTLNARERSDWAQLAGILVNIAAGSGWFLFIALVAPRRRPAEIERVDQFFRQMHTPVDFAREESGGSDNLQAKIMGRLCVIYGGFITLLAVIPNPATGRVAFLFCGGVMLAVGWALHRASKCERDSALPADQAHGSLSPPLPAPAMSSGDMPAP